MLETSDWFATLTDSGQLFSEHRDKRLIAQDLNQAAWVRITEKLDTFKDGNKSSISGWLWRVASNVVNDWKDKARNRNRLAPMSRLADAGSIVSGTDGRAEMEFLRPNPWYKRGLRTDRIVRKNRSAVLCPECGVVVPVVRGRFTLECGHTRRRSL